MKSTKKEKKQKTERLFITYFVTLTKNEDTDIGDVIDSIKAQLTTDVEGAKITKVQLYEAKKPKPKPTK